MNAHGALSLRVLPPPADRRPVVILTAAAVLPALQRYLVPVGEGPGGIGSGHEFAPVLAFFLSALLLFGVLPVAVARFGLRQSLADLGLRIGDARFGLRTLALCLPLTVVLLLFPASRTEEIRAFYPMVRSSTDLALSLLKLEMARGLLFYTAWEFFFRGFLLFGLERRIGGSLAICVQTVPSCLWHIGLPAGEIVASVLAGVALGWLALRTRSVLWPWIAHTLIGCGLDVLIVAVP